MQTYAETHDTNQAGKYSYNEHSTAESFKSTKNHLIKVYNTLGFMFAITTVGTLAQQYLKWNSFAIEIFSLILFGLLNLKFFPLALRAGLLVFFSFLQGLSISHLIFYFLEIEGKNKLLMVVASTTVVFFSFSISAYFSSSKETGNSRANQAFSLLSVFSIISIMSQLLCWVSLFEIFSFFIFWRQIDFFFDIGLYIGLVMISAYVIFDTQSIVVKFENMDDNDYISHAVELYTDFIVMLVKILQIFLRNDEKKDKKKERKEKDDEEAEENNR